MIINLLINLILLIFGSLFVFLPVVTLENVPYIGEALRGIIIDMVGVWKAVLTTFPYAQVAWDVFLYVIMPFEILLLVSKFFLGHRSPHQH